MLSTRSNLRSVRSTREVIDICAEVRIQGRFGLSENWIKISKVTARELLASYDAEARAEDFEGFDDFFGSFDGHTLYLG